MGGWGSTSNILNEHVLKELVAMQGEEGLLEHVGGNGEVEESPAINIDSLLQEISDEALGLK